MRASSNPSHPRPTERLRAATKAGLEEVLHILRIPADATGTHLSRAPTTESSRGPKEWKRMCGVYIIVYTYIERESEREIVDDGVLD